MTPSLDSSPRLNFDIFCVVYGFLSRRRASVLMKTCRILYQTGIPHLLDQYRPFPPCISTIRQLESFCKFMLAQTFRSNRIRAFNSLEVSVAFLRGDEEHDMVADQLAQVLNQGCYLKDLRLLEAETYFRVSQLTVMSLSNLPELTTLQIAEIGRRSMKAFKEMKSPISSLDIGYPLIGEFNLLPDLHDVASTLTELYVGYYALSSMSKVFPYMRDLHLESYFSAENVEVLVHVFPNLSNLSLSGELDLLQTENVDDVRQRNRKSMNQLSNQWRSLEYLHGDVAVVYSLGLTCQVRELSIGTVDEVNLQWTLALLVDLRPQILNIDARCRTSPDTLLQPLFDQASSTCRSLTIHFDVDNIQMPILDILASVVVLLKRLSPSSLVLHLVHHHLDPLLLNRSSPADNSDPIGDALDAIDLDSLASVLATNLQTLRYVGLVVGPRMMWAPRPFWRIRRECGIGEDKERVVLERVPESEGRRAMKEPTNE